MNAGRRALVLGGLLLAGCGGTPPLEPTLASLQAHVFTLHCATAGCHAGPRPESLLNLERGQSYAHLVHRPSAFVTDRLLVKPGDPDGSYLLHKLEGRSDIVGEAMPLGHAPLPDSLIAALRAWVAAGAPPE